MQNVIAKDALRQFSSFIYNIYNTKTKQPTSPLDLKKETNVSCLSDVNTSINQLLTLSSIITSISEITTEFSLTSSSNKVKHLHVPPPKKKLPKWSDWLERPINVK